MNTATCHIVLHFHGRLYEQVKWPMAAILQTRLPNNTKNWQIICM